MRVLVSFISSLFQFLIGRLSTFLGVYWKYKKGEFQFLIGRLSTEMTVDFLVDFAMFQFLIGRLSTNEVLHAILIARDSFNSL